MTAFFLNLKIKKHTLPQPLHPTTFLFSIGGFGGPSSNVVLEGTRLICRITEYGWDSLPMTFVVSVEHDPDWESLVKFIRKLNWEPVYFQEACDGTGWQFEYADSDFSLASHGSNAYPKKFNRFLRLLNKVVAKYHVPEIG
jgi:hypothetical protein